MLLPMSDIAQSATSSLLSFSVNDTPVYIEVINVNIKEYNDTVAVLLVLTSRGSLQLYVNELVSPKSGESSAKSPKKPAASASSVKPVKQLNIESKESAPLKITATFLCNSKNERVDSVDLDPMPAESDLASFVLKSLSNHVGLFIVYGSSVSPRIEKLVNNYQNKF